MVSLHLFAEEASENAKTELYSGRSRNIERFDETGKNDYNNNQFHHNIITDIEFFLGILNMMRE